VKIIIDEDHLDHVLLWLLCDMSGQQADSESLLQKKFPTFQFEKHFFRQFLTSFNKVSKLGNFLQKIQLEGTVNNGEASIVI